MIVAFVYLSRVGGGRLVEVHKVQGLICPGWVFQNYKDTDKEVKNTPHQMGKYFLITYLIKGLYVGCIKNAYNSVPRRQFNLKMGW